MVVIREGDQISAVGKKDAIVQGRVDKQVYVTRKGVLFVYLTLDTGDEIRITKVTAPSDEEALLKSIEEAPDGSFSKAWGYAMYGAMKAIESSSKR